MRDVIILGGGGLLKRALIKSLLSSGVIIVDGDSAQDEPCTKSEIDALTRLSRRPISSMDCPKHQDNSWRGTKHQDNSWRGGARKKGGKIGYRRG